MDVKWQLRIFNKTPAIENKIQVEDTFFHVGAVSYLQIANIFPIFMEVLKLWISSNILPLQPTVSPENSLLFK